MSHFPAISENDVAIIGMSCRVPGAETPEAFWRNLRNGKESISWFTDEELARSGVSEELLRHPQYVKANAVVEGIDQFDAAFFGFTPREAGLLDPQQRMFLECAWEALESAGYNLGYRETAIGCFAGAALNTYLLFNLMPGFDPLESAGMQRLMVASDKDFLATRVSYKLDLRGPSMTVQTACSSSLVAVHQACQSILSGECDLAMAGGVCLRVPHRTGYLYQDGGVFSPDGHCRPFDELARGMVIGNGAGVVVLKRLSAAMEDGDTVLAVIKGSAVNNDGMEKAGYTAPSLQAQASVIAEAQAVAGIKPEKVTFVEAHGTGTELGDPIEVAALTRAFRAKTRRANFCALGSVKSNFGHLDAAAGVASLIKTILALQHRQIPPTLHFQKPNPKLDLEGSPFYVNPVLIDWNVPPGMPRVAGVSSFGIGGTNAHLIVAEAPPLALAAAEHRGGPRLLVLSARTSTALSAGRRNLAADLRVCPDQVLDDVAFTLSVGRRAWNHRSAVVCGSADEAVKALLSDEPMPPPREVRGVPGVVFLFPREDAQHARMPSEIYSSEPRFRAAFDDCARWALASHGLDIHAVVFGPAPLLQSAEASAVQAAMFAVEYALAQLWVSWGVKPAALLGQGSGEYLAATVSGVFSLEDGLSLVIARKLPMKEVRLRPPAIPFLSNLTGTWIRPDQAIDPNYWFDQKRDAVGLSQCLETVLGNGNRILLEVGPGQTLSTLVLNHPSRDEGQVVLASLPHSDDVRPDRRTLLGTLGKLWVAGCPVDWPAFWNDSSRRRIPLPTHHFERRRHWVDPQAQSKPGPAVTGPRPLEHWFYAPIWKRSFSSGTTHRNTGPWVVALDELGWGCAVAAWLRAKGESVLTLAPQDFDARRIAELAAPDLMPGKFLYLGFLSVEAAAFSGAAQALQELLSCFRNLPRRNDPWLLFVVTHGAWDVLGSEALNPAQAAGLALVKVIRQEHANVRARAIDLEHSQASPPAVDALCNEFSRASQDTLVALRGPHRWIADYAPVSVSEDRASLVRAGGVYLVLGGFGRIGGAIAAALTEGQPVKLMLAGRSSLPERSAWEPATEPAVLRRIALVRDLEKQGAEVGWLTLDLAESGQTEVAWAETERRFGRIDGVVHAAGIKVYATIDETDSILCERHLAPKLEPMRGLDRLLQGRRIDFIVVASSLASVIGAVGLSAYTAAHLMVDAFVSEARRRHATPWLAINWDNWSGDSSAEDRAELLSTTEGKAAFLESLRLMRQRHDRVVISKGDLAERIRTWVDFSFLQSASSREPASQHPEPDSDIPAPAASAEAVIAGIWHDLLGVDPVGMNDNFLELGGDSVLGIMFVAKAASLGLHFSPRDIFDHPTVAQLAAVARRSGCASELAEQGAVVGRVPLHPMQRWFFARRMDQPDRYLHQVALDIQPGVNGTDLRAALVKLVAHHDALRARFERDGAGTELLQNFSEQAAPGLWVEVDLASFAADQVEEEWRRRVREAHRAIDLARGPLTVMVYGSNGPGAGGRLIWMIHHLVVDGWSWRVLLEDLHTLLDARKSERGPLLAPKTCSYREWNRRLPELLRDAAEMDRWTRQPDGPALPVDFSRGENDMASARRIVIERAVPAVSASRLEEALVTQIVDEVGSWAGTRTVWVDIEGHGRGGWAAGLDVSRTVGWFTALFPLRLEVGRPLPGGLSRIPNGGIGFGVQRYLTPGIAESAHAGPELSFLFLGQAVVTGKASPWFQLSSEQDLLLSAPGASRSHLLEVQGDLKAGVLRMSWTYSANRHYRETIDRLATKVLDGVVERLNPPPTGESIERAIDFAEAGLSDEELADLLGGLGS